MDPFQKGDFLVINWVHTALRKTNWRREFSAAAIFNPPSSILIARANQNCDLGSGLEENALLLQPPVAPEASLLHDDIAVAAESEKRTEFVRLHHHVVDSGIGDNFRGELSRPGY